MGQHLRHGTAQICYGVTNCVSPTTLTFLQVAQLPAAQKAVLAAHQEKDKLQKSLDEACAQVLSAEDAIEQKDKDMLDLEGRLAEAVGGITGALFSRPVVMLAAASDWVAPSNASNVLGFAIMER